MPRAWPWLSVPVAKASVSTTVPVGVWKVVSSTRVRSRYRRLVVYSPAGRIDQCPAASSSSRPKIDGLSKRGKHSQSTDPSTVVKAAEWQSDRIACAAMGTSLMPVQSPVATVPLRASSVGLAPRGPPAERRNEPGAELGIQRRPPRRPERAHRGAQLAHVRGAAVAAVQMFFDRGVDRRLQVALEVVGDQLDHVTAGGRTGRHRRLPTTGPSLVIQSSAMPSAL